MIGKSFELYVSYSQVCFFDGTLAQPYNDWSQAHVDQGFSWRPGSACFRTLVDDGLHQVEVHVDEQFPRISEEAKRVIRVPFVVPESGEVELASISESHVVEIAPDYYSLQIEMYEATSRLGPRIVLRLAANEDKSFEVVKADDCLSVPAELMKEAHPAG
ncbi:MAG: hypothetical protein GY722_18200 [bacterium]|nr:hypothetical protein [bacterium]